MGKRLIKSESGMAMVAVMMALLVLSILGTAAVTMAASNVKVGLEERELQASYYIAEAGITYYMEDLRSDIIDAYNNSNDEHEFYNLLLGSVGTSGTRLGEPEVLGAAIFKEEYGSVPDSIITLKEVNPLNNGKVRQYILESTGTVDGISRTVTIPLTLQWKKESSGRLGTDYAVFTYGHMNAEGGKINGPIASLGNLKLGGGGYIQLNGSAYSKGDLEFNNGVASNFDADSDDLLYSQGNMKITGGTVNIPSYSNGTFSMSNGTINSSKEYAVFSEKEIKLTGGTIRGNTGTNSTADGAIDISSGWGRIDDYYLRIDTGAANINAGTRGSNNYGTRINLPSKVTLPEFPELPELSEENLPIIDDIPEFPDFPVEGHYVERDSLTHNADNTRRTLTLTDPITYIPQIRVTGGTGCELVIKYHDGDILLVDSIETGEGKVFLESLEPDGEGLLNLYVRGYFGLGGGSSFNYTTSNDYDDIKETAEKLAIYIDDTASFPDNTLTLGGHCNLYGSVFAKDANLDFGNSYRVVGNVYTLGDSVKLSGNTDANAHLIYAPYAHVEVSGSGKAYGPIIANTFKISGGGLVHYDPSLELPEDPFPGEEITDPNELIYSEGPIREK